MHLRETGGVLKNLQSIGGGGGGRKNFLILLNFLPAHPYV